MSFLEFIKKKKKNAQNNVTVDIDEYFIKDDVFLFFILQKDMFISVLFYFIYKQTKNIFQMHYRKTLFSSFNIYFFFCFPNILTHKKKTKNSQKIVCQIK